MENFYNLPEELQYQLERESALERIAEAQEEDDEEYYQDQGEYDDSMDGDHASALASAGWGTDEDYGGGWDSGGDY